MPARSNAGALSQQSNSQSNLGMGSTYSATKPNLVGMDSKDGLGSLVPPGQNREAQASILSTLKGVKLSVNEQEFIKEYRKLEELEREKGIKFFQCVGDPPHTQDFVEEVTHRRESAIETAQNEMRKEDCMRYNTDFDRDKVVVDTTAS